MLIEDITIDYIKLYLRVDDNVDDVLIESLLSSAISYIKAYTGLTDEELNAYESLTPIILIYISNLYDNRTLEVNERVNKSKNSLINGTLDLYRKNNIAL